MKIYFDRLLLMKQEINYCPVAIITPNLKSIYSIILPAIQTLAIQKIAYAMILVLMVLITTGCKEEIPDNDCLSLISSPQINTNALKSRVEILAADEMLGRWIIGDGIGKAADFIKSEMQNIALTPLGEDFLMPFFVRPSIPSMLNLDLNGKAVSIQDVILAPSGIAGNMLSSSLSAPIVYIGQEHSFKEAYHNLFSIASASGWSGNYLALVHPIHKAEFIEAQNVWNDWFLYSENQFISGEWPLWFGGPNILFILSEDEEVERMTCSFYFSEIPLNNVIGVIPGTTTPEEIVVISAHFDHLGIASHAEDSIYNGANNNATGVAAMLTIAEYYAGKSLNERSLWFVGLNGREKGRLGSKALASYIHNNKSNFKLVINIDKIGHPAGMEGDAYFIGYNQSHIGNVFSENLLCSDFTLIPDRTVSNALDLGMDHRSFRDIGITAHSITTFNILNYEPVNTVHDVIGNVDFEVLERVTQTIILGMKSFIE